MKKTLLIGEPMALFMAQNIGPLESVQDYSMTSCGAELNVAIGMKRLNHEVGYYTKLGTDPFGKLILNTMKQNGISTELITYSEKETTGFMLKSLVKKGDPEIFYYRKDSAASTMGKEDIEKLDLKNYHTIHMTGITPALSKSTREATNLIQKKAHENNIIFSFDPNIRLQLWHDKNEMIDFMNEIASKSDLFLPGINEAEILMGSRDPKRIAEFYLKSGTKTIIIKLGANGAYYATKDEAAHVEGYQVQEIIDTVGAGDGFAAGVLTALNEDLSLKEAVQRGNAIGAIQLMSQGDNDGLPTMDELNKFMDHDPNWRI